MNYGFNYVISNPFGYTGTPTSSSSAFAPDSYEARREKERKAAAEREARRQAEEALENQKKDLYEICTQSKNIIKQQRESIETNKKADGSSIIDPSVDLTSIPEKKTTGQKFTRWVTNSGKSLVNMVKGIAGWDEKGFNLGKFTMNMGMGALALGICFIPGGALALAGIGAVAGTGIAGYFGYNAYHASDKEDEIVDKITKLKEQIDKTDSSDKKAELEKQLNELMEEYRKVTAEVDKAQQNTALGVTMAATSAVSFINAAKASALAAGASEDAGMMSLVKTGVKAELSHWQNGTVCSATKANFGNMMSKFSNKKTFQKNITESQTTANTRLTEIDSRIAEIDGIPMPSPEVLKEKNALLVEKFIAEGQNADLAVLSNPNVTKVQVDALRSDNFISKLCAKINDNTFGVPSAGGGYEINLGGSTINVSADEYAAITSRILASQKGQTKALTQLISQHDSMMRSMAGSKVLNWHKTAADNARVDAYLAGTPSSPTLPPLTWKDINLFNGNVFKKCNSIIGPYNPLNGNLFKTKAQIAIGGSNGDFGMIALPKAVAKHSYNYFVLDPASTVLKASTVVNPITTNPFSFGTQVLSAEEVEKTEEALDVTSQTIQTVHSKVSSAKTEEELIKAQLYVQALSDLQTASSQSGDDDGITMKEIEARANELLANAQQEAQQKAQKEAQQQAEQQAEPQPQPQQQQPTAA